MNLEFVKIETFLLKASDRQLLVAIARQVLEPVWWKHGTASPEVKTDEEKYGCRCARDARKILCVGLQHYCVVCNKFIIAPDSVATTEQEVLEADYAASKTRLEEYYARHR